MLEKWGSRGTGDHAYKVPCYAKLTSPMFSDSHLCLQPLDKLRKVQDQDKENTFADDTIRVLLTQNLSSCYLQLPVMPLVALGCNCGLCDCCVIDWRHLCYSQATGAKFELWYDSKEHIQRGKNTVYRHLVPEILLSMVCLFPVKERKKRKKKVVLITFECLRVKSKLQNENSFKQNFMLAHFPPEGEVNHFCLKQTGMHLFMITKKTHHYLHHKLKTLAKNPPKNDDYVGSNFAKR